MLYIDKLNELANYDLAYHNPKDVLNDLSLIPYWINIDLDFIDLDKPEDTTLNKEY